MAKPQNYKEPEVTPEMIEVGSRYLADMFDGAPWSMESRAKDLYLTMHAIAPTETQRGHVRQKKKR